MAQHSEGFGQCAHVPDRGQQASLSFAIRHRHPVFCTGSRSGWIVEPVRLVWARGQSIECQCMSGFDPWHSSPFPASQHHDGSGPYRWYP